MSGGTDGRGSIGLRLIAAAAGGATAAVAARLAYAALIRRPPGGTKTWSRTNHRGEPVTLLEGPAVAAGAIAGLLAQAALGSNSGRTTAMAVAGAGAAAFGAYDDLAGSGDRRGFRGHLGALAHGEVTTGAVKLGGIGAAGILGAAVSGGSPANVVINAGLIAGSANLLNLFDLRPGRAIKVAVASGALLAVAPDARQSMRRRWRPRWPCCLRTSASGPCSATRARTGSARCSAPRPPACPGWPGSHCWPGSPG